MKRILHISDLHVNPEMPSVKENKTIVDLVNYLKSKNEDILILIFTGDLIDFRHINEKLELCSTDEADILCRELMSASYEKAYEYLSYICESLNISPDHRLMCCGNHDIISDENKAIRVCLLRERIHIRHIIEESMGSILLWLIQIGHIALKQRINYVLAVKRLAKSLTNIYLS